MFSPISVQKSNEILKLTGAILRAQKYIGASVVSLVENIEEQIKSYLKNDVTPPLCLVGIKEKGVPIWIKSRLTPEKGYINITVDKMAPGGRAVDPGLLNPLTGKMMTGSTSGGAFNLLNGIIDIAIGTDGGGSVLGPALATQLFAMMGKGLGLGTGESYKATDGRWFEPSIGVLGRNLKEVLKAMEDLIDMPGAFLNETQSKDLSEITIGYPSYGITLPNGEDMCDVMKFSIEYLKRNGAKTIELKVPDNLWDRQQSLKWLHSIFNQRRKNICDVIITREGPIDFFGVGDSVIGHLGKTGEILQKSSGKYVLRSANMAGCTALAVPSRELATGYIIVCSSGVEAAKKAVRVAACLAEYDKRPPIFTEYFENNLFHIIS
ncbi:amidase, Asp-tRNAAsn/Glu-tRNAGln amidotransferase A subunit [Thermoanaerobacter siderophilus]|uniref:Amidase, Asp-tRNAAsn/Glu-tRNAGln amidotransferase A subunit n=1 Tax=Thermoanaerobacter siderophilus SR4 TaxID=880478 RepID=I8QWQ7_9THEO|nr:amidase, Asp-tRNAAsn/Glu-tRNAGln amidotransferase A subunit [Thermoanaerobacter siderophilus]EIV99382.1 amidase, Asp-tRNAAsn/Glu-tRNAGln amidotransferase A subunit [Thermoanaerobacter siderophilus SR4]